ncbi:transport and Golgi organization protein 2 homolog [Ornithodoros turicata]|uniref:transport and Golgi organization protein 2 homolog n=1 Tax=Ornithodoros turicata TaxID=34597 RepID=UPI003139C8FF
MCMLFLYTNPDPGEEGYSLVLLSVRDEYFHRPSKPAHFWEEAPDVLGGRDQEKGREGGTWLAVTKTGRIATLLNILQSQSDIDPTRKGRGFLVVDFVKSSTSAKEYLEKLSHEQNDYNGYILVTLEMKPAQGKSSLNYFSNMKNSSPTHLEPGFHAFGNSVPPHYWTKVKVGKTKFESIVKEHNKFAQRDQLAEKLFEFVQDSTPYPVDIEMKKQADETDEMLLCRNALRVLLPKWNYGTRTHTILVVNAKGQAELVEKTMKEPININGDVVWETRKFTFTME